MTKIDNWIVKKEYLIKKISDLIKKEVPYKEGQIIIAEGILSEVKK